MLYSVSPCVHLCAILNTVCEFIPHHKLGFINFYNISWNDGFSEVCKILEHTSQ